jgi:hypothetical protein
MATIKLLDAGFRGFLILWMFTNTTMGFSSTGCGYKFDKNEKALSALEKYDSVVYSIQTGPRLVGQWGIRL